jgi:RNA polymerase sigma-70 factor (ECF subfamily)
MSLQDKQILNKLKQGDQAEDIVQDVFVKFWDAKTYLRIKGTIESYFFKAVKNNCINLRKLNSRYRFDEIEDQVESLLDDEISHEEYGRHD